MDAFVTVTSSPTSPHTYRRLVIKSHVRIRHLNGNYTKVIKDTLAQKYPATFTIDVGDQYSFESYKFAWQTIQVGR